MQIALNAGLKELPKQVTGVSDQTLVTERSLQKSGLQNNGFLSPPGKSSPAQCRQSAGEVTMGV